MAFDWHQFYAEERPQPAVVDPRRRMRLGAAAFFVALAVVLARVVQLEVAAGDAFRTEASKPLSRRIDIPGLRGRILARDGTVLACDHKVLSLAIHYRYLEEPCNRSWLRLAARSRLSPAGTIRSTGPRGVCCSGMARHGRQAARGGKPDLQHASVGPARR